MRGGYPPCGDWYEPSCEAIEHISRDNRDDWGRQGWQMTPFEAYGLYDCKDFYTEDASGRAYKCRNVQSRGLSPLKCAKRGKWGRRKRCTPRGERRSVHREETLRRMDEVAARTQDAWEKISKRIEKERKARDAVSRATTRRGTTTTRKSSSSSGKYKGLTGRRSSSFGG